MRWSVIATGNCRNDMERAVRTENVLSVEHEPSPLIVRQTAEAWKRSYTADIGFKHKYTDIEKRPLRLIHKEKPDFGGYASKHQTCLYYC